MEYFEWKGETIFMLIIKIKAKTEEHLGLFILTAF